MAKKLRILANNLEDLQVFSTVLQDAAVKVGDMAYFADARRFAAVTNRYLWEGDDGSGGANRPKRTRSGFRFEGVTKAAYKNVPMGDPNHVLELLTIEGEEVEGGAIIATLIFSGYAAVRLELECIDAFLEDLSEPWRAARQPDHELD